MKIIVRINPDRPNYTRLEFRSWDEFVIYLTTEWRGFSLCHASDKSNGIREMMFAREHFDDILCVTAID